MKLFPNKIGFGKATCRGRSGSEGGPVTPPAYTNVPVSRAMLLFDTGVREWRVALQLFHVARGHRAEAELLRPL